jgi:hypothetical protein
MDALHKNLGSFFTEVLSNLNCQADTRAYIISIFDKYKSAEFDLSNDSITTVFCQARQKHDFSIFRNLGDWLFFSQSVFPTGLDKHSSRDYQTTIAQMSFYTCYRMTNKSWQLYEEMSDRLTDLEQQVKSLLDSNICPCALPLQVGKSLIVG